MKKTLFLAASLFLIIGAINAQDNDGRVHFGLKAGMNASTLTKTSAETKIGYNAGVLAHIHTNSKSWAIQPEVYYSLEGAKTPLVGSDDKLNINLSYVNVPVLVQYLFDNGFRVEAGPQIGFLLSSKHKVGGSTSDIKGYESTNISIPVGLGYLTRSGLGFDARYNFGLTDVSKGAAKTNANTFQFGLFYQFSDSKMK